MLGGEIMEEIIKNILQIDKEAIEKQERTKQVLEEKENQKKAVKYTIALLWDNLQEFKQN